MLLGKHISCSLLSQVFIMTSELFSHILVTKEIVKGLTNVYLPFVTWPHQIQYSILQTDTSYAPPKLYSSAKDGTNMFSQNHTKEVHVYNILDSRHYILRHTCPYQLYSNIVMMSSFDNLKWFRYNFQMYAPYSLVITFAFVGV